MTEGYGSQSTTFDNISHLSAFVLYGFLRQSSVKPSKTSLWLSYALAVYAFYQVSFYSLLLAVGLIEKENVSYPFGASIMVFAYLPFVAVLSDKAGRP